MDWKDIAGTVAKAAPILGTILGGPVGGAIGGVIGLLGSAFGLTPEQTTPDKINQMLLTDPSAAVKLAEIESNHKLKLQEYIIEQGKLALELQKAEFADTDSARSREKDIVKATGKLDYNLYILAWVIVLGFFGLTGMLMNITLPTGQNEVVFMLFGGLVSAFSTVIGYFFGSSRGSALKSEIIANGKK
jgi:hypothetical protein